jgi:hypothetical protein
MRSAIAAKVKGARFPEINTVDGFDFDFDPVRKKLKARYIGLHDATFIDKGIDPLFIGTPGTGKTYLARAAAWRVCQVNRRVVVISAPRLLNELHGAELHGGLDRAAIAVALGCSAVVATAGPIVLALLWRRTGVSLKAWLVGALTFVVLQFVFRLPWQIPLTG